MYKEYTAMELAKYLKNKPNPIKVCLTHDCQSMRLKKNIWFYMGVHRHNTKITSTGIGHKYQKHNYSLLVKHNIDCMWDSCWYMIYEGKFKIIKKRVYYKGNYYV